MATGEWSVGYTYTPDLQAQYNAFLHTGPPEDRFAIRITDGQAATVTPVITVQILPVAPPDQGPPVILGTTVDFPDDALPDARGHAARLTWSSESPRAAAQQSSQWTWSVCGFGPE